MEDQKISFETAELAYLKGFDPKMKLGKNTHYDGHTKELEKNPFGIGGAVCHIYYTASTQSLLQEWLRGAHKIHIMIQPVGLNYYSFVLYSMENQTGLSVQILYDGIVNDKLDRSYKKILEEALQTALNLIKTV